jgi:aspartyl-tRNA(Asn)/glutamyl-tRNA(Gln) amidotransferase subunit B
MQYDVVIGLEVHVQIRTQSKMFCCCPNRYGADPNTLICPVCMGYPGVLPVANEEAIKKTILSGLMCNCQIATYSKFDRKSYFYPDMPKNYQISQYDLPLCVDGRLEVSGKGLSGVQLHPREIGITRIHLEEDVGKSIHLSHCSGIDFNRAGVPLMEIVSEPDITSPDEAYAYLIALKQIMKYAEISDCDMEKGQMRCDVNISLMPTGAEDFNPKTEVKNLNSFRAVHRALQFEIERQSEVLNNGDTTQQETRGWNDDSGETYVLRKKESAHDYRYFPEPDLMPLQITADLLEVIRKSIPETPGDRKKRLVSDYNIPEYDAAVLTILKVVSSWEPIPKRYQTG